MDSKPAPDPKEQVGADVSERQRDSKLFQILLWLSPRRLNKDV